MVGVNQFPEYQVPGAVQHQWNPYENNGGWEKAKISLTLAMMTNKILILQF
jgi:hypothetical protein